MGLVSLALSVLLAWLNARNYAGARLSRVFAWLGAASALLLASELAALLLAPLSLSPMVRDAVLYGLAALGCGSLVVAGLILFGDTDLAQLRRMEKALLLRAWPPAMALVVALAWRQGSSVADLVTCHNRLGGPTAGPDAVCAHPILPLADRPRAGLGPAGPGLRGPGPERCPEPAPRSGRDAPGSGPCAPSPGLPARARDSWKPRLATSG